MHASLGVTMQTEPPPKIRTEPPPDPLPDAWARAIANSIAAELRHGWKTSTARRAISSTGAPITGRDYLPTGGVGSPAPTSELISRELYARALTDEIPALDVPALLWSITQLDLAAALNQANLMQHAGMIDVWLKQRPSRGGRPAALYHLRENRHEKLTLRRNSDHAPDTVARVFLAAAHAATVTVPDPLDVADALAEWERISLERVLDLVA